MKRFLFFASIACAILSFTSCEKSYKSGVVTFYGNVVDADTGTPLPVAQVEISGGPYDNITSVTAVTGSDGTYQADVTLPAGETKSFHLYINVTKQGYVRGDNDFNVSRDMVGQRVQHSFTLKK